ncbi:MAG TPA: hypothetical protein VH591_21540 [Ktedonobacterales bacterium]
MLQNTSPSHISFHRSLWLVALLLLLVDTMLAACGVTPVEQRTTLFGAASTISPTATPTVPAPTNTAQPTSTIAPIPKSSLPTLTSAAGWHTVLTLSDTTGAHGDDIAQGTFIASKPYVILYSCKGSGALKVLYPGTIGGAECTGIPKIHRTGTINPAQPGDPAFVTASPDGTIIWELLISMKD